MIGQLKGILASKKPPFLLIDVNGVGYELQAPMSTIYQLPDTHATVTLYTHLYVREDAQVLYGFFDEHERVLFRTLIKISGVGPKMALTILSGIEVGTFMQCVERRDALPLTKLPGVGKKTAERLIIEMSGKLKTNEHVDFQDKMFQTVLSGKSSDKTEEAISALMTLGYKPQEASRAILNIEEKGLESQELIRRALRKLAKV